MSDVPEGLEAALGAAFADPVEAPKAAPKQARTPEPDEVDEPVLEASEDPADLLAGEPEESEPAEVKAEAEPEFEIEIEPGKPEVLTLSRMKELAARGAKAGRGFEENARIREALQAHVVQQQLQTGFQQAVSADIGQIQALENQLRPYEQIDWQKEYDNDPFNALKLKEQRDQLREYRAAAINNLNAKQQQFQQQFQQNSQRVLAAEQEALLAKVPAWRNAEKAKQEQGEIAGVLTNHYGYTPAEVGQLMDHRALMVARDAAAYRKLLANKDARVKQAREAPATAKPGAASQPNGRANTTKALGLVKAHGAKGNHTAQEQIMTRLLGEAFK
jgi:hypothetical protein